MKVKREFETEVSVDELIRHIKEEGIGIIDAVSLIRFLTRHIVKEHEQLGLKLLVETMPDQAKSLAGEIRLLADNISLQHQKYMDSPAPLKTWKRHEA